MKKIKKILAAVMTLAMVLGMSMTTFAAPIGGAGIAVSGLSTSGTQKVDIYLLYSLDENNNNWVKSEWLEASKIEVSETTINDKDVLTQLKDYVQNKENNVTADDTKSITDNNTGSVSFENLKAGAYLVLATDVSNKVTYNTMVAVTYQYDSNGLLVAHTAPVVAKASGYSTDKSQETEAEVVEVGDLITYTITTTVPYVENKNPSSFTVTDTLTGASYYLKGEAVKGENAVSRVTVNGNTVEGIAIPESAHGLKTFTIDLSKLLTDKNTYAGQSVVITYTAKVEAVDKVTNTAISTNDPKPENGTTTAVTGTMTIEKYAEEEGKKVTLSGAEFAVYRYTDPEGKTGKQYAVIDDSGFVTGDWITREKAPDNVSTVTTNASGIATVKGLDEGTYYFEEIVAPDGYSINEKDSECIITFNGEAATGTTTMVDTKLASLPSTGGIGTTIFTIGGCIIMIAAAGLFFASRRKSSK